MTTRHVLVGERVHNPSGRQIRKIVGKSHRLAGWAGPRPGYYYSVVRAISARVNQNFDGWPSEELKQAAHTFVGKPVFVNHENFDPKKARGVVVAARYVENGRDKYIETVMEIDARRFPLLASVIADGSLDSVSMGAEAGFTVCSACGNKAYDEPDMCDHVKYHKGKTIRVRNRKTGKVGDKLVFESCHKLSFFELSYVFDPADETAVMSKVIMARAKQAADCPPGDPSCSGWNKSLSKGDAKSVGTPSEAPSVSAPSAAITTTTTGPTAPAAPQDPLQTKAAIRRAVLERVAFRKGAPFAEYTDFDDCTSKNSDKGDADAYCGEIKHRTEDKKAGRAPVSLKERVAVAAYRKLAYGEVEAPPEVDTLRVEGTAPEDDNDDFHHYVDSPPELSMPDLSEAAQLDREQEEESAVGGMDTGTPGPSSPEGDVDGQPPAGDPGVQGDEQQYMTLKIPVPQAAPPAPAGPPPSALSIAPPGGPATAPVPPQAPPMPGQAPAAPPAPAAPGQQVPMQAFGARVASPETLAWFERYYGYRVADWRDAIEAGRDLLPEEHADYIREARLLTLENGAADSPTSRNHVRGTANMARSTLASRQKTAGTRHFAEGPLTDGGDVSRNDQGEQEEAFITETPSPDSTPLPDDDATNISNTEDNLVADEEYAHSLTARMHAQQAALRATANEYAVAVKQGRIVKRADEFAGGPVATEVNPEVPTPSAEQLTGDDFDSADPGRSIDTSVAGPGTTTLPIESSLQAFRAFDKWLTAGTGKSIKAHSEANIKKAAKQFADYNGVSTQVLFPALGIALRQARKAEAAKKAQQSKKVSNVRKQAVDLETAAPDERVSVPTPVSNTTDSSNWEA